MKNVLRTIWTVIKLIGKTYGILTVGMWALIGVSNLAEKIHDNPWLGIIDADVEVIDDAFERFKTLYARKD